MPRVLILLLIALCTQASGAQSSSATTGVDFEATLQEAQRIRVNEPMVVAFAPTVTDEDEAAVTDKYVAMDDFQFYLPEIKKWCTAANIPLRVVLGTRIQLLQTGSRRVFSPRDSVEFGLVLARPDGVPKTLEGVQTGASFLEAACPYFSTLPAAVRACKPK